jgi:ADP-ribosylation factor related protein 1
VSARGVQFSLMGGFAQWMCAKDEAKILVVGLSGGGKTTLVEQFKRRNNTRYAGIPLDVITPTIGMNLARMSFPGIEVTIWDVGGSVSV